MTSLLRTRPGRFRLALSLRIPLCFALLAAFAAAGCSDDNPTEPAPTSTSEVVITSSRDTLGADIFARSTDPQAFGKQLIENEPYSYDPRWSPDGSKIAFVSLAFSGSEICVVNADGTAFTRVTQDSRDAVDPAWIPTTGEVAFQRSGIEAISLTDQSVRTIVTAGRDPSWTLDGTRLAYSGSIGISGGQILVAAGDGTGSVPVTDPQLGFFYFPAWSPDGSKLACSHYPTNGTPSGIFVMQADGGNLTRLTSGSDASPCWSPDGSRIVFARGAGGPPQLYVMNADGSNVAQITSGPGGKTRPDWSPDGRLIVYQRTAASTSDPLLSLWIVEPDGKNSRLLYSGRAADMQPAWSERSSELAFASNRYGDFDIFASGADDEEPRRVTSSPGNDHEPAWSQDGASIAFTSDRDGNEEIYRVSPSGQDLLRLTNHPGSDYAPSWSTRGDIAFVSERDGNPEIYLMSSDGSNVRRRTVNAGADTGPAWSPDGSRIAFASNRDGNLDIFVMYADGTGVTRLTTNAADDRDPAWSSDGRRIAFVSTREGSPVVYWMYAGGGTENRLGLGDDPAWGFSASLLPGDNPVAAARP